MRRMVCVWLPRFRTDRIERAEAVKNALRNRPLAVITAGKGGNRLIAVNVPAENLGLRPGMLLTDASAIAPELKTVQQEEAGETSDLKRLALWCRRFAPWTGEDTPDGLWLDITGAAHLFGGAWDLLQDIQARLQRAGFETRAAIASTHAAAWGLVRYAEPALTVAPPGQERGALAFLPVAALNIDES